MFSKKNFGFTIVELIVAITVLGLLTPVVLNTLGDYYNGNLNSLTVSTQDADVRAALATITNNLQETRGFLTTFNVTSTAPLGNDNGASNWSYCGLNTATTICDGNQTYNGTEKRVLIAYGDLSDGPVSSSTRFPIFINDGNPWTTASFATAKKAMFTYIYFVAPDQNNQNNLYRRTISYINPSTPDTYGGNTGLWPCSTTNPNPSGCQDPYQKTTCKSTLVASNSSLCKASDAVLLYNVQSFWIDYYDNTNTKIPNYYTSNSTDATSAASNIKANTASVQVTVTKQMSTLSKKTSTASARIKVNTANSTSTPTTTPTSTLITNNTYSQSSVYSGSRAANWQYMNNNDARGEDTYSNSQTGTNNESQPWIKTDLKSTRIVSHVILGYDFNYSLPGGWGPYYTTGSTLQGSNDGTTWTDIASVTGCYDENGLQRIDVKQYWRYLRVTRSNDWLALLEFQVWEGSSISTAAPSQDPYYCNVVALLNLNGDLEDGSILQSSWIPDGSAKLTTFLPLKFGTAALDLSDGNGYIRASAPSSNFVFNSGQDFTIEAWIYPTNANQGTIIDSRWGGYSYYILDLGSGGVLRWAYEETPGNQIVWSAGGIDANQWQHVAVSRASGVFRMFINGKKVREQADSRNYTGVGTQRPTAGTDGNGPYYGPGKFYGYMDGIRITRAARYTENFTPPINDYPTQ